MQHPALAAALALALVAPLPACGEQEVTVTGGGPAPQTSGGALTLDGPGRRVDEHEAEQALIGTEALPKGARYEAQPVELMRESAATSSTSSKAEDPVQPAACDAWFTTWRTLGHEGAAGASRSFYVNGDITQGSVDYAVRSYADPTTVTRRIEHLRKAPQDCASFTTTQTTPQGLAFTTKWELGPSDFPRPGDLSYAVKMRREHTLPDSGLHVERYHQLILVQVGHNEIMVQSVTHQPIAAESLASLVSAGFDRLDRVAAHRTQEQSR